MGKTSREIDRDCQDIPVGWPRPFYRDNGKIKYAQWSSDKAEDQIFACSTNRTAVAAANFLCSSCGHQMAKGLIFDQQWLLENAPEGSTITLGNRNFEGTHDSSIADFDEFDTHYGSPICYRCALFAVVQCPYFSEIHRVMGGDIQWFVMTSPSEYREFDESTGLEVIYPDGHHRIMTSQVRGQVQDDNLFLTEKTAHDFEWKRPTRRLRDEYDGSWYDADVYWDPEDYDTVKAFFQNSDWKSLGKGA